jgi:hypothetical protein
MNDADGLYFDKTGKLPHDSKHSSTYEEWYAFDYEDLGVHNIEFYLLFKSPPGTTMKLSLYKDGDTNPLFEITSSNSIEKISDGGDTISGGRYLIRIQWISGNSCDVYKLKIGDGCCSNDCACGWSILCFCYTKCNTGCPSM